MHPQIARYVLLSEFFILIMSVVLLPFIRPEAPEFVPDILAIVFSSVGIIVVVYDVRRQIRKVSSLEERSRESERGHITDTEKS